jgi:ferredoxin-NADP reductase
VLIESSYGVSKPPKHYDLLLCVAGGAGITAVLPYLRAWRDTHAERVITPPFARRRSLAAAPPKTESEERRALLYWGCRSSALVAALSDEVECFSGEVRVGSRLDVKEILRREIGRVRESGTVVVVVVSGPKGMADDVRSAVVEIAKVRRKGITTLLVECFGW